MHSGPLFKMSISLSSPITYALPLGEARIPMNELIGQEITLSWGGAITCSHCNTQTKKSYSQGHCFPCARALARCDLCIMRPQTCHYAKGTCREPTWGETHCLIPHIVYLANSSGLKVGITRGTQVPTRWIDQGAEEAIPLFEVATRKISGDVEVILKDHVSDRTNWRKLLKGPAPAVDIFAARDTILKAAKGPLEALMGKLPEGSIRPVEVSEPTRLTYPIEAYPKVIKSLNMEKTPQITGVLQGIKGQYLLFPHGALNIRKYTGYDISLSVA